ncbi:MAG: putative HTH-type transcriptional regulator [Stenotrophomonas maltophilia]|uniref:Putative HTH-type transcriptional regulator n=1 Tax=Stenotrophomonas maltophilia TaxID=40324 RepID=A0A7V8JME6_STEMA|nr:MAG: putative HTH-type transcriptional regulator [Stenotrophomonas maltophilia]
MLDNLAMAAAIRSAIEDSKLTQKGIADAFGVTEQAVSGWLRTGKVDKRKLPKLAQLTGKPLSHFGMGGFDELVSVPATSSEYVRVQQLDAEAGMGGETINDDYPEVIRAMDFEPAYIRSIVGFVPAPGRLVLVTGRGDSMIPVIQPGESLMVDTGISHFDGDGIYLINTGNGQQIKGLQDRGDSIYVVSANTALYPAFPLPKATVIGGKVYLRNRIDRLN